MTCSHAQAALHTNYHLLLQDYKLQAAPYHEELLLDLADVPLDGLRDDHRVLLLVTALGGTDR